RLRPAAIERALRRLSTCSPRFFTLERGPFERIDDRRRLSGVPFRLLGLAADPDHAGELCGQTFARYAASGIDVTLVCAAVGSGGIVDDRAEARRLGVRDLVLLDYDRRELASALLQSAV